MSPRAVVRVATSAPVSAMATSRAVAAANGSGATPLADRTQLVVVAYEAGLVRPGWAKAE
jgi:hypothetical protein